MSKGKLTNTTKSLIFVPILYLVVSGLYFILFWPEKIQIYQLVGVIVTTLAFTLWITARIQLGNAFSIAPKAKFLVQAGIYSKLRHPVYYFSILALGGIALFSMNIYVFAALVFLVIVQVLRIRKEERILLSRFGKEYRAYKKNTWF